MQNSSTDFLLPVVDGIPGPVGLLSALLFLTFILHLLLMNAVVGVAVITFVSKLRALLSARRVSGPGEAREERADGPEFTQDTLLPKGVALTVNLGIPPFLFLQCLFVQYIYVSSILMAQWWLAVMLVVMLAYYGLYLNMARHSLSPAAKTTALGLSVLLLLFNAFLFVNNMTLLQHPEQWTVYALQSGGSFLNLTDPQVLPRYLHIILACLAVGGLCLALPEEYALRKLSAPAELAARHAAARSSALSWFIHATLLQLPAGLWFFLSLDESSRSLFTGGNEPATALACAALLFLAASLLAAWKRKAFATAFCAVPIVICMAGMRSLLREAMLGASSHAPSVRPFEAGPVLLFLISLLASAFILYRLAVIYLRDRARPVPVMLPSPLSEAERRNMLLVLELPRQQQEQAEADGKRGAGACKGGPESC